MRPRATLLVATLVALGLAAPAAADDRESTPAPGIRLIERTTTNPARRIFIAEIALCDDGIRVEARASRDQRITASVWAPSMDATLAVNGDFFRTDTSRPVVYGDAVGEGQRWPSDRTGLGAAYADDWYHGRYGWIAFGDGWVEFRHTGWVRNRAAELGVTQGFLTGDATTELPPGTRALVSGFPELVVEGQVVADFPDRGDCADRHPRTAMGLSEDRSTFYLVAVDGRSTSSVGATCKELAPILQQAGAWEAFNLDGGGSTEMWVAGRGTINRPSDGASRPVANFWGVIAGGAAEPASCFQPGGCFPSPIPTAATARFRDLPDDDARAADAARVVDAGLLGTCQAEPPMFCPGCGLTRRDAIVMVVRGVGLTVGTPPAAASFADVPADAAGFAEIEAARAAGLTEGCGDGKLCPDAVVTRGELAALVARARGWTPPTAAPTLADVPADHPHRPEIEAVAARCAGAGCATGFCPDDAMPRADAASLAAAAFGLGVDGACDLGGDGGGGGDGGSTDGSSAGGCAASGAAGDVALLALLVLALAMALGRGRQLRVR